MSNNIIFEKSLYGTKAIISGIWDDIYIDSMYKNNVSEIEINDGKGWKGNTLEFLKHFPSLKSLIIIDLKIQSVDSIYYLKKLKNLQLITYSKDPINFLVFTELESCDFEWIRNSDSLFKLSKLKKLFINNYLERNDENFSNFTNLEEISIFNSNIEKIEHIFKLKNLKKLRITNLKKIDSIKGINQLENLEVLEIQKCKKISTISNIFEMINIKILFLIDLGDICSLKGIENLLNLESLMFYESTNIVDGDLLPLTKLKKLNKISFQNRKHYSHKREDFICYN